MANKDAIISALGEAREHIILNKYNDAMMLMAQITIDVIEHLTDEALIVSKGYEEDLKTLKTVGIIADDTAHNFETLIISGVQAHNGVDIPKEHVEQALQVLTNELDLIFKKEDAIPTVTEDPEDKARFNAENEGGTVFEYDEDEEAPYPGDFSQDKTLDGSTPAFLQKPDDSDFRKKEKMRAQLLASEGKKVKKRKVKLVAILIPILAILLLVFVVRGIGSYFGDPRKSARRVTVQEPVTEPPTEPSETEPIETEPPKPVEAGYYNVTGDLVKVRNAPTTENSKVLGTVSKGDKVQVKQFHNNEWALISYEGNDAYIARRYIERDTNLSPMN